MSDHYEMKIADLEDENKRLNDVLYELRLTISYIDKTKDSYQKQVKELKEKLERTRKTCLDFQARYNALLSTITQNTNEKE